MAVAGCCPDQQQGSIPIDHTKARQTYGNTNLLILTDHKICLTQQGGGEEEEEKENQTIR